MSLHKGQHVTFWIGDMKQTGTFDRWTPEQDWYDEQHGVFRSMGCRVLSTSIAGEVYTMPRCRVITGSACTSAMNVSANA